jgi:phage-related protein
MPSQVETIRFQLDALATDANNVAAGLANFSEKFTQTIEVVQSTIGGTSTDAEREIVDALTTASEQVTGAMEALTQAAQKAQEYAQVL